MYKNIAFLSLKIDFDPTNSADTDEIPHGVAFHTGLHYLSKHPFRAFLSTKGKVSKHRSMQFQFQFFGGWTVFVSSRTIKKETYDTF